LFEKASIFIKRHARGATIDGGVIRK